MKKVLLLSMLFISTVSFSQSRYRNTGIDTAASKVNAGYTNLSFINIVYTGTTRVFLKFYDQTAKPTTSSVPALTLQINSASILAPEFSDDINGKLSFKNGLWIRCTTGVTDTSSVPPATKPLIELGY